MHKVFQTFAILIGIGAFIALVGGLSTINSYNGPGLSYFWFTAFGSALVSAMLFWAIGRALELIEELAKNTRNLRFLNPNYAEHVAVPVAEETERMV